MLPSGSGIQLGRLQPRPQVLRRAARVSVDSSLCNYTHRVCMQPRIEGYEFCTKHILEDKNAPYKQCQYTSYKTNKRCTCAAIRGDKKDGYCPDHARRAAHIRLFINRKRRPKQSPSTLLEDLEHHVGSKSSGSGESSKKARPVENVSSKILEYASSSDSESECVLAENCWRGDGDSDAESVDSEQEDPLKHAGVYTAEEVALITRDKLIRLQSLYIDQFKRLQHVMREKRRKYLHSVKKEREALGSIHYAKHDPEQSHDYECLVAMKRYHHRYGQEALLHRESKERRIAVSEGANYKPPSYPKCVYNRNNGKCGARTIPLSKYCLQHILNDPNQVLYKPCDLGGVCKRPISDLGDSRCRYHFLPGDIEYRLPVKKEEKEECRDEIDVVGGIQDVKVDDHQSLQLQLQLQEPKQLDLLKLQDVIKDSSIKGSTASATITKDPNGIQELASSKPEAAQPNSTATSVSGAVQGSTATSDNLTASQSSTLTLISTQLASMVPILASKPMTSTPILAPKPSPSAPVLIPKTPKSSQKLPEATSTSGSGLPSPSASTQVPSVVSDLLALEQEQRKSIQKKSFPPPGNVPVRPAKVEAATTIIGVRQDTIKPSNTINVQIKPLGTTMIKVGQQTSTVAKSDALKTTQVRATVSEGICLTTADHHLAGAKIEEGRKRKNSDAAAHPQEPLSKKSCIEIDSRSKDGTSTAQTPKATSGSSVVQSFTIVSPQQVVTPSKPAMNISATEGQCEADVSSEVNLLEITDSEVEELKSPI